MRLFNRRPSTHQQPLHHNPSELADALGLPPFHVYTCVSYSRGRSGPIMDLASSQLHYGQISTTSITESADPSKWALLDASGLFWGFRSWLTRHGSDYNYTQVNRLNLSICLNTFCKPRLNVTFTRLLPPPHAYAHARHGRRSQDYYHHHTHTHMHDWEAALGVPFTRKPPPRVSTSQKTRTAPRWMLPTSQARSQF